MTRGHVAGQTEKAASLSLLLGEGAGAKTRQRARLYVR